MKYEEKLAIFKCRATALFPIKPLTLNFSLVFGFILMKISKDYQANLYCGSIVFDKQFSTEILRWIPMPQKLIEVLWSSFCLIFCAFTWLCELIDSQGARQRMRDIQLQQALSVLCVLH